MGQSKEIKQKRKGPKYLDLCFSVIFNCYGQSVFSGRENGYYDLVSNNYDFPGISILS